MTACGGARQAEAPPATPSDAPARSAYCDDAPAHALACVPASAALSVQIRSTDLLLGPQVHFTTADLSATLTPRAGQDAVVLDALDTFTIAVHQGHISLDAATLQALVSHQLADDPGVRRVQVRLAGDRLHVAGEFQRRGWVAFEMTGRLQRADDTHLAMVPDTIVVDGRAARRLMAAAHLRLADIVKLSSPGITIDGDRVLIDIPALLPPPRVQLHIASAHIADGRLLLHLDDGHRLAPVTPAAASSAYVLLHGGRLAIGPLHLTDPRIQLTAADNEPLTLSLPRYREQLARYPIRLLAEPSQATFVARLGPLAAPGS